VLAALGPGSRLRFARSGVRTVQRIAGGRVWVVGAPLDPRGVGAPHAVEVVDPRPTEPQRWASLTPANQNAISGFESAWVFDPICNARLRSLMAEHFELSNPWFDLQARYLPRGLTPEHVAWLRFLGVTRIRGYAVRARQGVEEIAPQTFAVEGELPRAFLIDPGAAHAIDDGFDGRPIRETLGELHTAIGALPAVTDVAIGVRDVAFEVERPFTGQLVVTQAYAHAWTFEGAQGEVFCRLYPAWQVALEPGRTYRVVYRPPGLTRAFAIGAAGLVVLALSLAAFGRLHARARATG
jgi:hypothetical protein